MPRDPIKRSASLKKSNKLFRDKNPDYHSEYMKLNGSRYYKNFRAKHILKFKARQDVNNAIAKGLLLKPMYCSDCDKYDRIEAHHEDYNKPLEIIWLCKKCHIEYDKILHKKLSTSVPQ